MAYAEKYLNKYIKPVGTSGSNVRASYSTSSAIVGGLTTANAGTWKTTGNFQNVSPYTWYEVKNTSNVKGWLRNDVFLIAATQTTPPAPTPVSTNSTDKEAQALIDALVKSDQELYNSMCRTFAQIQLLYEKGVNVTSQMQQLLAVYNRWAKRQTELKNNSSLKTTSTQPPVYTALASTLQRLFSRVSGDTVGAIPLLVIIIVVAIVSAGAGVAVYKSFQPKYSESTVDLKISKELEKALATLDPATANKVKQDLEGQVDNAHKQGVTDGKWGGMLGTVKYLAVGLIGFYLVDKFFLKKK